MSRKEQENWRKEHKEKWESDRGIKGRNGERKTRRKKYIRRHLKESYIEELIGV
jgi:hypothetical protein